MFDTILVPLDGSQLANCVLPHVVAIARPFEAEITLLRILEKSHAVTSAQLFDLLNWQINKTKSALYLDKIRARLQKANIRVQTEILEGLIAEGITEYAQSHGMKLIILSSHGRHGLTQRGISSTTQKIISRSRKSETRVTKGDIGQVEQFFNGMSNHANQATQRQPVFGNGHSRFFQANSKMLTMSDV